MSDDPQPAGWARHPADPGFAAVLGPVWRQADAEGLRFAITAGPEHRNSVGTVHGGLLVVFADQALGWIVRDAIKAIPRATVQLDVHFLAPARPGDFIEACGRVVRRTRSMIFMRGALHVGGQEVLAAHGIWKLPLDERAAP